MQGEIAIGLAWEAEGLETPTQGCSHASAVQK